VKSPYLLEQFLVARMRVHGRRQRRDVPREPLGQEEVPGPPVDFRHGRMSQAVKGVEPVEPGLHLPRAERELDAAGRDACPALRAEERVLGP